jgi:hypothetical protein
MPFIFYDSRAPVISSVRLLCIAYDRHMPSLEIICIAQREPSDFSNLPFTVKAEKKLVSHRSPNPLFHSEFDRLHGFIYHVSDGQSPTCYSLLVRNWYDEQGDASVTGYLSVHDLKKL